MEAHRLFQIHAYEKQRRASNIEHFDTQGKEQQHWYLGSESKQVFRNVACCTEQFSRLFWMFKPFSFCKQNTFIRSKLQGGQELTPFNQKDILHITDLCCLSVITKHYFLASNKTKLWQFIPMILNSIKNVVHQTGSFNLGSLYIYRPKRTESLKPIIYFYFPKFISTRHTKSLTRMPCDTHIDRYTGKCE